MSLLLTCISLAVPALAQAQPQASVLLPAGAVWKYLDDGSDPGPAWAGSEFDDSAWPAGPAQLGYGENDESSVLSFGGVETDKHITAYFRRSFTLEDPQEFAVARLRIVRDDGAVIHVNGIEVQRLDMPPGALGPQTLAARSVFGSSENVFEDVLLPPTALLPGSNVIAVEIHQASADSSDLSFDLELVGERDLPVVRGPYLQSGTPEGVTICWSTGFPSTGVVRLGAAPDELSQSFGDGLVDSRHELVLRGLQPDTRYYYSVGFEGGAFVGGDEEHFFVTAPTAGTSKPTRVWVLGDSGTADARARRVRDAYYAYTGERHTDLWLMLGDNAYEDGKDSEYQEAVFDMYPEMLRKSVLWPSRGNHDMFGFVYRDIFSLPRAGEAGGVPSGSEAYYSFDHGNAHFICIDSFASDNSIDGAMYRWLESDLAATDQDWLIAFWHHPPYSKGSHDSDAETRLIRMRKHMVPLLEEHGVDLVLSGHSHSYERSYLIDGHYGDSDTFEASMLRNGGDGRAAGDGSYLKLPLPHAGAVYCVAGSSGKVSSADLDHPAMFHSVAVLGSVVLDIDGPELEVTFLDDLGEVEDRFMLEKMSYEGLSTSAGTLSHAAGGTVEFALDAGVEHAQKTYVLLGSASGTTPGVQIDQVSLPLNFDGYTLFILNETSQSLFQTTYGFVQADGKASSSIQLPPANDPAMVGLVVHHAYLVLDLPGSGQALFATNAFPLKILP